MNHFSIYLFIYFPIYSYFPKHKDWEPIVHLVCNLLEEAMWDHMRKGELSLFVTDPEISTEPGLAIMEKTAWKCHILDVGWKDWWKFLAGGNVLRVLWTTSGRVFWEAERFVTPTDSLVHEDLVWLCWQGEAQGLQNPAKSKDKSKLQCR